MNPAIAAAIWGPTYVTTDIPRGNPFFIAATRALDAGLLLLLICRQPPRTWLFRFAVLGTFNCGILFALLFVGALQLPGGVAGTLHRSCRSSRCCSPGRCLRSHPPRGVSAEWRSA